MPRISALGVGALLAALHGASAAPCDMTKLGPVLQSPAMAQCTNETTLVIPNIAPYATGYDRVPDAVCLSKACGSAIEAIQALQPEECDLPSLTQDFRLANVTVKLYKQHLYAVFDACGNDTTQFGPSVTPDAAAMDKSSPCTPRSLATYYWGHPTELAQCVGADLKALVSSSTGGINAVDVVASFTACPACASIRNATTAHPVCSLPGRNVSFRSHIEHAFAFCDAVEELRSGGSIPSVLVDQLLNSSKPCVFESTAMQAALARLQDELQQDGNEACGALLIDPLEPISPADQATICDVCPHAKQVISSMQLPSCQTQFGQRYDQFLATSLASCSAQSTRGSQHAHSDHAGSNASSLDVTSAPAGVPTSNAGAGRVRGLVGLAIALAVAHTQSM